MITQSVWWYISSSLEVVSIFPRTLHNTHEHILVYPETSPKWNQTMCYVVWRYVHASTQKKMQKEICIIQSPGLQSILITGMSISSGPAWTYKLVRCSDHPILARKVCSRLITSTLDSTLSVRSCLISCTSSVSRKLCENFNKSQTTSWDGGSTKYVTGNLFSSLLHTRS
jgi:hypothetical protein